ncbi:MAG: thermonuclease family protein [Pseudomonadales bacterium]|nr:thermonuclease family protein [Pseudomonadales bacterium]
MRALGTLVLLLGVAKLAYVQSNTPQQSDSVRPVVVANIYDGDTFTILVDGKQKQRVRFLGVDTPEINRPHCEAERALARKAKQFVVSRIRNAQQVTLKNIDTKADKYGRWLARVYVDGDDLAAALIAAKLGRTYQGGKRQSWCE